MKAINLTVRITILFTVLLLTSHTGAQTRKVIDFNKDWLFEQDDWIGFYHGSWMNWNETNWIKVQTPHSFNADDTFDPEQGYYRGFGWYRKHFRIPETEKGRILKIRFGAIGNQSEIWLNEQFLGKFHTGYTPIEVDISDHINFNKDNVLAIRVNNLHNDEIPPGRWRMDYNVYGGIYREVNLLSLSPTYINHNEHFLTTPEVSSQRSKLQINTALVNTNPVDQELNLVCKLNDGTEILKTVERKVTLPANQEIRIQTLTMDIKDISLWSPDNPKLYNCTLEVYEGENLIDHLATNIGFRSFTFHSHKGFYLNGEALKLRGLNRHQCYPGLANAVPKRLQVADAVLLKELGANYVRCAHYPQHSDFLHACDSLGLLVFEEVASWQHIGGDEFIGHMNDMLEAMIRRDRNHPSIILWGMMNEGHSYKMFEKMIRTAKLLDPSRPVSYAENHIPEGIQNGTVFQPDVLGFNYNLDKYDEFHEKFPDVPIINTECTNADKTLMEDVEAQIQATLKIKSDLDFIDARKYIAGACIWGFHDYGTEYKPVWPIQTSGVVDEYRNLKEAAHYLKARWSDEPYIHISGHWNYPNRIGETIDVYVFHNCDDVKLYLNGKLLEKENEMLWKVPYQPGKLEAKGVSGQVEIQTRIQTAGEANHLLCSTESYTLLPDGFDAIPLKITLRDNEGRTVPECGRLITFEVDGPGELVGIGGKKECKMLNGLASILVKSTGKPGQIRIRALSEDVIEGSIDIQAR